MKISIPQSYRDRQILLLGGLGFVGKVLLTMLVQKLPSISHIYVLVRKKQDQTAEERLSHTLETSPVFESLRTKMGKNFLSYLKERVTAIEGDANEANLGMPPELVTQLQQNLDLIINSAGLVEFNPDLYKSLSANLYSTQNIAEFVKQSKKGALLHLSTCYVAGNQSSVIREELRGPHAPNGKPFNVIQEIQEVEQIIQSLSHLHPNVRMLKSRDMGIEQAKKWGWPNIYTYTKALAESWLELQKNQLRLTIVRPSIVECAVEFPFPGWMEGYNTCGPLVHIGGKSWYPFVPAKKNHPLDVIPVDILCNYIVKTGAALIQNAHETVYQCATSERHPIYIRQIMTLSRKWHRKAARFSILKRLQLFFNLRSITPTNPLSSKNLHLLCSRIPKKLVLKSRLLRNLIGEVKNLHQLHEVYLPFIYDNEITFTANAYDRLEKQIIADPEFKMTMDQIDWKDYWFNIEMAGLDRWVAPKE